MTTLIRRNTFPGFDLLPAGGLSLFEDTLNRFLSEGPSARPWSPSVDIVETDQALVVTADVPGVQLEDIEIKIEDGTLSFSGKREFQKEEKNGGYHRIERSYGSFHRAFALPETVDFEQVSAGYENGVLKITLPKKEVAKPKTIKVSVGSKN
jgi:HSP20 family protein